ncbi:MAG: DUF4260 domain-containing protein [Chloroflexi bacterium]|nr:DUF4260 domain-containing protein [Chloroflexota bacterium]
MAPATPPRHLAWPRTLPGRLLRLEGGALLIAATVGYFAAGGHWLAFLALLLAPDLAMIGYLAGPRAGSIAYNLAHTTTLPLLLGVISWLVGRPLGLLVAAIWLAHIGLDRLIGYGLKYPSGFRDTHLDRV